VAGRTYW